MWVEKTVTGNLRHVWKTKQSNIIYVTHRNTVSGKKKNIYNYMQSAFLICILRAHLSICSESISADDDRQPINQSIPRFQSFFIVFLVFVV